MSFNQPSSLRVESKAARTRARTWMSLVGIMPALRGGAMSVALAALVGGCSLDTTPRPTPDDEEEQQSGTHVGRPRVGGPILVADPGSDLPSTDQPVAGGGAAGGDEPPSSASDAGPANDAGAIDPPDPVAPDAAPPADTGTPPSTDDAAVPPDAPAPDGGGLIDGIRDLIGSNPRVREAAALRRIENALQMRIPTAGSLADALDALEDVNCQGNNGRMCVAVCGWAMANCRVCSPDATCMAELEANCTQSCN